MAGDASHRLRWAIIGTGPLSAQIVEDLGHVEGAQPYAIASRDRARARQFAQDHAIPHAGSVDEVLALADVDLVYIATPHATHYPLARLALIAGKHVAIEKPAVLDAGEAADLKQLAQSSDVFLIEAMWMKFNPAYRELLRLLEQGAIGEVRSVRASFGLPFPRDSSSRWQPALRGSALLDQGIYPVTLARTILGHPDQVTGAGTQADGLATAQHMTFDYADGRFAHLSSAMTEFVEPTASISGTRGWVHLPFPFWATTGFTVHRSHPETFLATEEISYALEGNGYTPMLRAIQSAVLAGDRQHPWHSWDETTQVAGLLDTLGQLTSRPRSASINLRRASSASHNREASPTTKDPK